MLRDQEHIKSLSFSSVVYSGLIECVYPAITGGYIILAIVPVLSALPG